MRYAKIGGIILTVCLMAFGFQNCSDSVQFQSNVIDTSDINGTEITQQNADEIKDELQTRHEEGRHVIPEGATQCDGEEGDDSPHVLICHYPPGNHDARHTICVGVPAIKAHMNHGHTDSLDTLGACEDQQPNACEEIYSGDALKYHVATPDGRCVWSCAAGTQPDPSTGECKCQAGLIETGLDEFGRRVCEADNSEPQ